MSIDSKLLNFLLQHPNVEKANVPAGVIVSQQGDACERLLIVLKGQVKVYRPAVNGRSLTLYYVGQNDSCILTASCVLNQKPFPAFAETTTDVEVLLVPINDVNQLLETEPLWQKYIFNLLSERMMSLIELVNSVAFDTLESRLAHTLITKAHDQATNILTITHQEIAEELASSREVISRLLKKFESDGVIMLSRGKLNIIDNDKLSIISNVM